MASLPRWHGRGTRCCHDADLVGMTDTPAIALRARKVTAPAYVHPFGPLGTHSGRGEVGGRAATGSRGEVAHLGGAPPQRERHPGGGADRRGVTPARPTRPATGGTTDRRRRARAPDRRPRSRSTDELLTSAIAARARAVTAGADIHPYAVTDLRSSATEPILVPPPG